MNRFIFNYLRIVSACAVSLLFLCLPDAFAKQITQTLVQEGVSLQLTIETGSEAENASGSVSVQFKLSDAASGLPIEGLHPLSWIDRQAGSDKTGTASCRKKIRSFMQGSLGARPQIDLNQYFVLALNQDASISVIDPHLSFGGVNLLTMIPLGSAGEDWVASADKKWLFVTLPQDNQVAVIDTRLWKVTRKIDVGTEPRRIALQSDGKYLWVGLDGEEAVAVIDPFSHKIVKKIKTGAGHHEVAFSNDSRYGFVTNRDAGTLSMIDITRLKVIQEIPTGSLPSAVAFSSSTQTLYVAHESDGGVFIFDPKQFKPLKMIDIKPGIQGMYFSPDGRWGFLMNPKEGLLHILDASSNQIVDTLKASHGPLDMAFTASFAYLYSSGTEDIQMIPLQALEQQGKARAIIFQGGEYAPDQSQHALSAKAIVPTPERNAVLIANPADKGIHYYKEGMNALMGSFQNEGRAPKGVLVLDRSLKEHSPGVYKAHALISEGGSYDVLFLLDSPRIAHCFNVILDGNTALKTEHQVNIAIEPLFKKSGLPVGKSFNLRFKVIDAATNQSVTELKDMSILTFKIAGTWQKRSWAKHLQKGIYQLSVTLPEAGDYQIFFAVPSMQIGFNQLRPLILRTKS